MKSWVSEAGYTTQHQSVNGHAGFPAFPKYEETEVGCFLRRNEKCKVFFFKIVFIET
jgi:hypothetical protein